MRIIFVTGGVISSLGKGIVASIIGGILKSKGLKIKIKKIDPYLNVDPGTLSPIEHGEVFVTKDGAETDVDLGNYERMANIVTHKCDYITAGAVYQNLLQKERKGDYLGKTVQVIPHLTDAFQEAILADATDCDILICEIGGTVGDIENIPILESARQLKIKQNVMFIHVALLPFLKKMQEWKTKPIQHSVRTLLSYGIQPDLLLCRMEKPNLTNWQEKIAMFCNIKQQNILPALDAPSIYHAMLNYEKDGICERIAEFFNLQLPAAEGEELTVVKEFVKKLDLPLQEIKIAIVGKYINCLDSYKSLNESLMHASIFLNRHLKIEWIDAGVDFDESKFDEMQGIIVPGGFGERGSATKIKAISYARAKNIPFLGICFGMQLAIIEALQDVLPDVSSSEFGVCANPVIARLEEWMCGQELKKAQEELGGTMRLGSYESQIQPNTLAFNVYKNQNIKERHRHRYEFNNKYQDILEKQGVVISGRCCMLAEIIERPACKFFIATQFHPEFESSIYNANPIFVEFLRSADIG